MLLLYDISVKLHEVCSYLYSVDVSDYRQQMCLGTVAAAPPLFRPIDPALCGSCPLVTPYYCRLGDLLCLFCVYPFVCALLSVYICI